MGDMPNLEVISRIYKGRKAVGFRLIDMNNGQEYVQPDENVIAFIKAGVLTDLAISGDRIVSGEIRLCDLPKEDLDTGTRVQKSTKTKTAPRKQNKYTIQERHDKIINAFIDDGSIKYGLHTCLNMIKLYKSDEMVVKMTNELDIINGLDVVLEDTRSGLYYVFSLKVTDANYTDNEKWYACVEMVEPGRVKNNTKLSELRAQTHLGKNLHPDGYYINDDGKRVFVDMRSVKENDRVLNSKELLQLKLKRGNHTKMNEFILNEVVPIEGHMTQGRVQAILKMAQYMYMFNGLVDNINSKIEAN